MKRTGLILLVIFSLVFAWWMDQEVSIEAPVTSSSKSAVKKSLRTRKIAHANQAKGSLHLNKKKSLVRDKKIVQPIYLKRKTSSIFFEKYFDDDLVKISGKKFYISERLRTLPANLYELSNGTEIFRQQGYVFFESNDQILGQAALYGKENKATAVLTGRILLKNVSKEQALQIARQMQVVPDLSMSHLGIYAMEAPAGVFPAILELGESISFAEVVEGQVHEK